jgi:hypothetical protein
MKFHVFSLMLATAASVLATPTQAAEPHPQAGPPSNTGHWAGPNGWQTHPAWGGDIRHFNHVVWRGGHWWHGAYGRRVGWWWIVGPNWFWYPGPIYPYPDPFTPPGATPGYWYFCDFYAQYYPYVGVCPTDWEVVQPY